MILFALKVIAALIGGSTAITALLWFTWCIASAYGRLDGFQMAKRCYGASHS